MLPPPSHMPRIISAGKGAYFPKHTVETLQSAKKTVRAGAYMVKPLLM